MLEEDKKRVIACIYYKDYFSAMEYAMLVKNNYSNDNKYFFDNIIKYVKTGDYVSLDNLLL